MRLRRRLPPYIMYRASTPLPRPFHAVGAIFILRLTLRRLGEGLNGSLSDAT